MLIPQGCAINLIFYLHFDQIYSGPRPKFCPTSFCGHFRLFVFFYKNPFIWSKRKIIWVKLWLLKSFTFFASATFMDLKLKRLKETVLHFPAVLYQRRKFPKFVCKKKRTGRAIPAISSFKALEQKVVKYQNFLEFYFIQNAQNFDLRRP